MEQKNKETYWSKFTQEYEKKQQYVVGYELISLTKEEIHRENNLGKVLELGCGTGLYTVSLAKKAESIIATDYSEEMIEQAQRERGNSENVKFLKANALDLNFDEKSFDTVFMANLIHIIANAEKVIQESKRVLKKDGLIIITSFAIEEMSFFNKIGMGIRFLKAFGKPSKEATKEKTTPKSVEKLLVANSFEIIKSKLLGRKSKSFYIVAKNSNYDE